MSHYEFLFELKDVYFIHPPVYYDDGHFSVLVEDSEGYHGVDIIFDRNGNIIKE